MSDLQQPQPQQKSSVVQVLRQVFKTNDLAALKPMAMQGMLRGHDFAREKVVTQRLRINASPARLHHLVKNMQPDANQEQSCRFKLRDIIGQDCFESATLPSSVPARDAALEVTPGMYDLDNVLVTGISVRAPVNTLPIGVALGTNGLPPVYAKASKEQISRMITELGLPQRAEHLIVHIPANQTVPDTQIIHHLLKENVTSYHGAELCKTFGGLTAGHLYRGLIPLSPDQARMCGLYRPPASHDGMPHPDDPSKTIINSWVVVPMGHVLSHISSYPPTTISEKGYLVHQLFDEDKQMLPFLVMDTWTVYMYARATVSTVLLNQTPVRLGDLDIRLYPLKTGDWLSSCRPMEHRVMGYVEFTLTVSYVMFPRGFKGRLDIHPGLSARFPSMSLDAIRQLEDRPAQVTRLLPPGADNKKQNTQNLDEENMDQDEY